MAQRSAIGKAALPPQTDSGTARGLAKQVQVRPSIPTMLWGNLIRPHPPLPSPIPSSTQNAPGFAFFGLFLGALFCFSLFLGCKIFRLFFMYPAL